MRAAGVLAGVMGRANHIVKLRPPMVISEAEVDLALDRLAQALAAER